MSNQSLESFYSTIKDAIGAGNLSGVVDSARAGLKEYPKEAELAKVEIVALIKLEHASQALAAISRARTTKLVPAKAMEYEAAYCHFTLGSYADARNALKKASPGPKTDYLLAQIAYKCDQFSECVGIYKRLIATAEQDSQEHTDLLLNLAAAEAAEAQLSGKYPSSGHAAQGNYELMFNSATGLLASGKAQDAVEVLSEAKALAVTTLAADGWASKDIDAETGPIDAQRAIALQQLGNDGEARIEYTRLLAGGALDAVVRDVVSHNAAVLGMHGSGGDATRANIVKRAVQIPGRSSKALSHSQRALMTYNMAVAQLAQNQPAAARRSLRRLGKRFSDMAVANAGLVSAAISLRMGQPTQALNELSALAHSQSATEGVKAALAAAQTAIALGDNSRAGQILSEWMDKAQAVRLAQTSAPEKFARYYFGISLLAGSLSEDTRSDAAAGTSIAAAAARHLQTELGRASEPGPSVALLLAVGDCAAHAGDAEGARECFAAAKKAAASQGADASRLVSAHASAALAAQGDGSGVSSQAVAQALRGLSRRKQIVSAVPGASPRFVRKLQPRAGGASQSSAATRREPARSGAVAPAKKRTERNRARRQRRLLKAPPKGYSPARKPDSERWIPLRQRASYKARGRNSKQQKLRGGAQGGATEAGSGLGGTGSARIAGGKAAEAVPASEAKPEKSAVPAPSAAPGAGKGGPKGGKGKAKGGKGKKGGKW
ncbi:Signal recognition particle core component [Kickxella alabastrina]|uniref:Signal recognition particle core component n=1 Tax=Kickxella alabastrina TaxID=61397 RepID=A0ACC1INK1_9FUNG|nr:Signal recognition particle core component [Kickxella alabastrina]